MRAENSDSREILTDLTRFMMRSGAIAWNTSVTQWTTGLLMEHTSKILRYSDFMSLPSFFLCFRFTRCSTADYKAQNPFLGLFAPAFTSGKGTFEIICKSGC